MREPFVCKDLSPDQCAKQSGVCQPYRRLGEERCRRLPVKRGSRTLHAEVLRLTQRAEAAEARVRELEELLRQLEAGKDRLVHLEAMASLPDLRNAKRDIDALYSFRKGAAKWKRRGKLEFSDGDQVELELKGSGTYGAVYACKDRPLAVKVEILDASGDDSACVEQEISQDLHLHECAATSGMLKVQCAYHDTTWHKDEDDDLEEYARNVYLMPLMDGLVSDLYAKSEDKKATLRHILRVTREQLECMFSSGRPYIDLKLDNLMHRGDRVYVVDFGSMAGDELAATYPLPTSTDYMVPRDEAVEFAEKWIAWQLGVVAFQVAVDPKALDRWYYWGARKARGMRHPGPPVAETTIPAMLEEALPDDLEMQVFILAALNGKPMALNSGVLHPPHHP